MKNKILLFIMVVIATSIVAQNNVITYTANSKLPEATSQNDYGVHIYSFSGVDLSSSTLYSMANITSHQFSNGRGTITFNREINYVHEKAFYNCDGLTSIIFPNSIEYIDDFVFSYCTNLSSVTIGNNILNTGIVSFGSWVFSDCKNLISLTINKVSPPTLERYSLYGIPNSLIVNVPCEGKSLYSNDEYWKSYNIKSIESSCQPVNCYEVVAVPVGLYGIVQGGGAYAENSQCTLKALPKSGYYFDHWVLTNTKGYSVKDIYSNPYSFTVTAKTLATAYFSTTAPIIYSITLRCNSAHGSVSGGGEYRQGTTATIQAMASNEYVFKKWSNGSTNNPYSFTVTKNETIDAIFEKISVGLEDIYASPNSSTSKYIIDGQLYILRDGKTYNAQGEEVK